MHKGIIGEIYNIGSPDELENRDVAAQILTLFGYDAVNDFDKHIQWVEDRPFNDSNYSVDDEKLRQLGWLRKTDFATGLAQTVEWYRKFSSNWWTNRPCFD